MVDMGEMMKQMKQMQEEMRATSEELARETVTTGAGRGAVKATVNGEMKVLSIEIDPSLAPMNDAKKLSEMISGVLNEAIEKAQSIGQEKVKKNLKSHLNIPGLSDYLGK